MKMRDGTLGRLPLTPDPDN